MTYSIVPFMVRLVASPTMMVYLHKEFSKKKTTLATYPFMEKFGVVVVYVGTQAFLFTYTILGDPVLSLQPTALIFLLYLLYRFSIKVFVYLQYALGYIIEAFDYINEKLNRKNNTK